MAGISFLSLSYWAMELVFKAICSILLGFSYVTGAVIILLGLHQMEVLHLQGLYKERRLQLQRQDQNLTAIVRHFTGG